MLYSLQGKIFSEESEEFCRGGVPQGGGGENAIKKGVLKGKVES